MKRSEMIQIIEDYLMIDDGYHPTLDVDNLLKVIEKYGMLPPLVHSEYFGFESESKWEPEDIK